MIQIYTKISHVTRSGCGELKKCKYNIQQQLTIEKLPTLHTV